MSVRDSSRNLRFRPRTLARRLALQYLFMADIQKYSPETPAPAEMFRVQREAVVEELRTHSNEQDDAPDQRVVDAETFALELIEAVLKHRDALDTMVGSASHHWNISRIGTMERNILRIAAAELMLHTAPREVVLQEAVALAARFVDKEAAQFVNGVAEHLEVGADYTADS